MANPNWKTGVSGNPGGRKKNSARERLEKALKAAGKKLGKDFLEEVAEEAFTNREMRIVVLKMLVPTLKAVEGDLSLFGSLDVNQPPTDPEQRLKWLQEQMALIKAAKSAGTAIAEG